MDTRFLYALFPLGILAGYLIPRSVPVGAPASENETLAPRNSGPHRPRATPNSHENERISSISKAIKNNKRNRNTEQINVKASDVPAVIAKLLSDVGPSGLPYSVRTEINKMLTNWAAEDFDSAYAWACSNPNRNAAKDFLEVILDEHAKPDFHATMAMIHDLKGSDIDLKLGQQLFDVAAKHSAQDAFDVLSTFPSTDGSYSGGTMEFPPDFDFKTFAELTAAHMQKNGISDSAFSYFPVNALEEWAKVDSSAALEFYLSNQKIPNSSLSDITDNFLDINDKKSTYSWLAKQYSSLEGAQRSKFGGDLNDVFPRELGSTPLVELVDSLPTQSLKKEMIFDMIKSFGSMYSDDVEFVSLLNHLPTTNERLKALQKNPYMLESMLELGDERLAEIGVTKQQIENLIKK